MKAICEAPKYIQYFPENKGMYNLPWKWGEFLNS